jgi:hypothetical protein
MYDRKDEIMDNVNLEEMENVNWEDLVTHILESEKALVARNYPPPAPALLTWKHDVYLGSIQEVAPSISGEIVLLSKSTYKLHCDLVTVIRKLDKKRLELVADESLDLSGRQHVLRRLENTLVYMTSEQTEYMTNNLPDIMEI